MPVQTGDHGARHRYRQDRSAKVANSASAQEQIRPPGDEIRACGVWQYEGAEKNRAPVVAVRPGSRGVNDNQGRAEVERKLATCALETGAGGDDELTPESDGEPDRRTAQ